MIPTISGMPFQTFTIKTDDLQTLYIIFYSDGTSFIYGDIVYDIKIPKEYYDQMLQLVRNRWGEDYTPKLRIYTMEDALKRCQKCRVDL